MNGQKGSHNRTQGMWSILFGIISIGFIINGCNVKPKTFRVGILSGSNAFINIADGFKAKMTELGYIEGRNILYDMQAVNADPDGERRIAREFVSNKVDLIFAFPTGPALTAKSTAQGTNTPVVFAQATLEGSNLVESVPHPGGNITGVRYPGPDISVKRLEILLKLAPQIKRLYIIYDSNYSAVLPSLEVLRPTAASHGITLVEDPVNDVKELQAALEKRSRMRMRNTGVDAILIMPEVLTQSPEGWALISRFAYEHKLPVAGSAAFEADTGAVFSYIPDNIEIGSLAASQVDKIFKGTPAGSIFVITPDSRLRLNFKLARKLGLSISENMLSLANEIIR